MGQSRMRIANWWYSRKEYSIAVKCYKKALQYYNNIPTNQVSSQRHWTPGAYPLFLWDYRLWANTTTLYIIYATEKRDQRKINKMLNNMLREDQIY